MAESGQTCRPATPASGTKQSHHSHLLQELLEVYGDDLPTDKEEDSPKSSIASSQSPADQPIDMNFDLLCTHWELASMSSGEDQCSTEHKENHQLDTHTQLLVQESSLYHIMKRFFEGLTQGQKRDISRGHNNEDSIEMLASMYSDVLKYAIQIAIRTVLQVNGGDVTDTELLEEVQNQDFFINEHSIYNTFKGSLSEAFREAVAAETSNSMTPRVTAENVASGSSIVHAGTCDKSSRCTACKGVLSGDPHTFLNIQQSTSTRMSENTMQVQGKKTLWFQKLKKSKVQPVCSEQTEEAFRCSPMHFTSRNTSSASQTSSSSASKKDIPLVLADVEGDPTLSHSTNPQTCPAFEDQEAKKPEKPLLEKTRNIFSCFSCCCSGKVLE